MVSGAHLHLLVNHVPILGAAFALLLLAASYVAGGDILRRTALVVLIVSAAAAAASDLSGDLAEEAIEGYPGVTRAVIHEHEDMAENAYRAAVIAAIIAAGVLVKWRRVALPQGATITMLVVSAIVSGLMAYTGLLGGRVRHTEVRPDATTADAMAIEPPRARRPGPAPAEP